MKLNNFLFAVLFTLIVGVIVTSSTSGKQLLVVNNGLTVQISNGHRTQRPAIKFSLFGGSHIVKTDEHLSEHDANSKVYTLQLSDHSSMKLKALEKRSFNVSEYYLQWNGGGPNIGRELCFHTDFNNATWFSTYQSSKPHWPIERMAHSFPLLRFNSMLDYTALGEQEFYRVVEHLFLTTDGFALLLDARAPWFMRRDVSKSLLCFAVNNTVPYDTADHSSSYLDLKIHLFAASNIRAVTDYVVHRSGLIPRPKEIPDASMFIDPSYCVYNVMSSTVNQSELLAYAETINKLEFAPAEIMLDDRWSNFNSATGFDHSLYPDPSAMIATMHNRHRLKLRLQVYPTASSDSSIANDYFVKWNVNGPNSGVVDFSNPKAADWYASNMKRFRNSSGVNSFRIGGTVLAQNRFFVHDALTQKYPNLFITRYIETMEKLQPRHSISDVAFKSQHLPAFVRLSNYHQTPPEESLQQLVANALAVSIAGYSFIEPYQVGGFDSQPSAELYIRFVQATALMPRISFAFAPWVIGKGNDSSKVISITKRYIALHRVYSSTLIELAKKRVTSGEPMIRPMWYASPDDTRAYQLDNQFMLGENIVVAPVLVLGQRERTVFLPSGMWVDQTGAQFSGSAVVKVKVPLDQLAFFKRIIN